MSGNLANLKRYAGPYVPPAKRVKEEKYEIGSKEHQQVRWDENKRKINGLINRANISNLVTIVRELFECNLIRYAGLFASSLMKAQEASPSFTDVYVTILAIVNSRIRSIGALVVNRIILLYRVAFVNNNRPKLLALVKFIAHLTNQDVVDEVLALQLVEHLTSQPTPSSIEVTIAFLKDCGAKLDQVNQVYLHNVFKTLRDARSRNNFDTRTESLIELIHAVRRDKFREFPPIKKELEIIDDNDKVEPHQKCLDEPKKDDFHMEYNYFKYDQRWIETEAKYSELKKSWLEGDESSDDSDSESGDEEEEDVKPDQKVIDATGTDLIEFRKTVYQVFYSNPQPDAVVHILLKKGFSPELYDELCWVFLDSCEQERHYKSKFAIVASRLCRINRRVFAPKFEKIFGQVYEKINKLAKDNALENNRMRKISAFYAHLLLTDSIDWLCLNCLRLRKDATTSPGRCFIKFLFEDLISMSSLAKLIEYTKEKREAFQELLPRDEEQDTRFAIDFFTGCHLEPLVEDLKQELISLQNSDL